MLWERSISIAAGQDLGFHGALLGSDSVAVSYSYSAL
jgi:hypothetical protein